MLLLLALLPSANALPPDHEVRRWEIGDLSVGAVERMAISSDGGILVGRTRANSAAWLVDIDRWELVDIPAAGCEVNGVAPVALEDEPGEDETWEVWLACADGSVSAFGWDGRNLFEIYEGDAPLVIEVDTQLSGIWYDPGSQLLYGVSLTGGTYEQAQVHVIDRLTGEFDQAIFPSYPKLMPADGFVEGTIDDGYLLVSHGTQDMSTLLLGDDAANAISNVTSGGFRCQDLVPSPRVAAVHCVDEAGSVAEYGAQLSGFNVLPLGVLTGPKAVASSLDPKDGWIAVTGTQVKVWEMDASGTVPSSTPVFSGPVDANNPIQDMVTDAGYLYGGGEGGALHIVTARPWVDPETMTVTPSDAVSGDTVTVTFQVDSDSDWVLNLGGDRNGEGRIAQLAEGSTTADTVVVVPVVVDDAWIEGDNALYVIATDDQTLLTGHARGSVVVDDPPDPPALTDANVEFGDGALTLSFDGIKDEDLARYEIFVSTTPFVAADWVSGGPAWDGSTNLAPPLTVSAKGGEHVTKRIAPLENDVTYYIGVHAWDTGGKEGPMSRVVQGTPRKVYSASDLAGDEGGTPCGTGPRPGAWLGLAGIGALALTRRRRAGAAALLGLMLVSPAARAQAPDEDHWWEQDTTPTRANFELRYGNVTFVDQRLEQIYNLKPHDIVFLEIGPQFFHVLELDFGFGFMQDLAFKQDEGGVASGERTMLTWWPLALDATLRAHFVDEQPVVPFVRYGWDYLLWSEKRDSGIAGEKDVTQGGKFGTHFALGGNVLLDVFQPGRASFLETQTGINDSWITIEWRRQRVDARATPWDGRIENAQNALDFSGDVFTVGLKLDW